MNFGDNPEVELSAVSEAGYQAHPNAHIEFCYFCGSLNLRMALFGGRFRTCLDCQQTSDVTWTL